MSVRAYFITRIVVLAVILMTILIANLPNSSGAALALAWLSH